MEWFDNVIGFLSPETAYRRNAYRLALKEQREYERMMANYDGASYSRINSNWFASNEPAELTDRGDRDVLRARARDLERNSDIMNSVIGAYKRNVYGAGYRLRSLTGDETLNTEIERYWEKWCKKENCDVSGTQSFNSMMRMALTRKKIDGGILILKCYTAGGLVPFKLQLIEVDDLDDMVQTHNGNKVVGGIEYNKYNKPIGFHLRQYGMDGYTVLDRRYVDAKDVIYYFTKKRPTQIREVSDMAPTLTRVRDINEFIHTISVKERILACLSVFVQREIPQIAGRTYPGDGPREYQGKTLTPGMIQYLSPGDKAYTVQPTGQAADAAHHIQQQLRFLGAGQGLSYETTSRDMSQSTYSSARQGSIEDDLTYEEERQQLEEVMDEIYETFVISLWLSKKINNYDFWKEKDRYLAHSWIHAPKRWIDPQKEANANAIALKTGQKTWADMAAENGKDWREQIDEIKAILDYGESRGINLKQVVLGENVSSKDEGGKGEKETE